MEHLERIDIVKLSQIVFPQEPPPLKPPNGASTLRLTAKHDNFYTYEFSHSGKKLDWLVTEMADILTTWSDRLIVVFDCNYQWGSKTHQNNCRWKLKSCLQSQEAMERLVVYTALDNLEILQRQVSGFLVGLVKTHPGSGIGLVVIDNVQQYEWQSNNVQEEIYRICRHLSEKFTLLQGTNFVVLRRR